VLRYDWDRAGKECMHNSVGKVSWKTILKTLKEMGEYRMKTRCHAQRWMELAQEHRHLQPFTVAVFSLLFHLLQCDRGNLLLGEHC
jgi:hypothetical protein